MIRVYIHIYTSATKIPLSSLFFRNRSYTLLLEAGTTNIFRSGPWSSGDWYQTGSISGSGALTFDHEYAGSANRHLSGSNAGYTGTIFSANADNVSRCYVGSTNGLGTGTFLLQGADTNKTILWLDKSVSLANVFAGTGRIDMQTFTLTHTGTLDPGGAGGISTLAFGNGALDFRGTYHWQFNETTNDLIIASTLSFGGGSAILDAEWIGAGPAPNSEFVIMSYTGPDPVNPMWSVKCRSSQIGKVRVDSANKRLLVKLASAGTVVFFK